MEIQTQELSQILVNKAVKTGFDEAIAFIRKLDTAMAKIANSELSVVQRWNRVLVSLYLTKDRRIFVVDLEPSSITEIEKSVEALIPIAKVVESSFYAPLPKVESIDVLNIVDKDILDHIDNLREVTELLIEASHREKIDSVAGMIELNFEEKALAASAGFSALERKTWLTSYVRAFVGDGSGQWSFTSTKFDRKSLEAMALTASKFANECRKGRVQLEPGKYDVILSPMVVGNLMNYLSEMASAFSVLSGTSIFMRYVVGDKVSSEKLSIYDAPRDTELPGATGLDDEGVRTYNKPIIEDGVLKTLLHNTKTAHIMKTTTTGNAGWINPRPWNIVISKGTSSLDEMISEVRRGLLITNNWYTRLHNYVEGSFSTVARDAIFLIEDGKIVNAIDRIRISDTFSNILNNMSLIGKDLYNVRWWEVDIPARAPYILVKDVRISRHIV